MNHERETTRAVEAWLAEPIPPLDDRVVDAAIERLPSTPQRRRWWPLGWLPSRRDPRTRSRSTFTPMRLAAGVAIVVLAGSVALIAGPLRAPTEPFAPGATTSVATPDGLHVSGRIEFWLTTDPPANYGTTTGEADGSSSYRDAYFQTRWTADDPRFDGRGEYTSNSNTYAIDSPEEVTVGWGTQTLTTDEGTWTSRSGSFAIIDDEESVIPVWFDGSGAYEGMSAFLLQQIHPIPDSDHAYLTFEGWIVAGDRHFTEALE